MKIIDIKTENIRIPLVTPFKTALRTTDCVDDIIVKVITDTGAVGYGEAPPTAVITGDTKMSVVGAIEDFIRPSLIGYDIENLDGIMKKMHGCIKKNTSAKAAVDMAVYDLFAQKCGMPLYKVLGGGRSVITTDLTISVNPVEVMVEDAKKAVAEGFTTLKIKVGKDGRGDVERMKAIRDAVGSDILLRVDANQGWGAKQAVSIISAMEAECLDIELVEQPTVADDFEGLKYVTDHVRTPILADESVFSVRDAVELIKNRAADLINIKLMKTGGIHEALKICGIAETYGVECMAGCMLESKIAVSAAAHLAAGRSIITKADLDGPALCKYDPYTGGPEYKGEKIIMNETPGIGITYGE